jgi:hypothetical protein
VGDDKLSFGSGAGACKNARLPIDPFGEFSLSLFFVRSGAAFTLSSALEA